MTTEQNPAATAAPVARDPYDAMGPVEAANPPPTRRVQLGHHHAGDHTMPSAGGRGDEPWPEIDMILADVYSAGAEGLQFEGVARRAAVRAAVAALAAQPSPAAAVPTGWKLAPIEPTWSMRNDGREFLIDGIEKEPERLAYFLWKTMINAAPEVQ